LMTLFYHNLTQIVNRLQIDNKTKKTEESESRSHFLQSLSTLINNKPFRTINITVQIKTKSLSSIIRQIIISIA
ncbi:TPA: hypothetical protein ACHBO3_002070, partial [Streptococcus pneumoniae]